MFPSLLLAAGLLVQHEGRLLGADDQPAAGQHSFTLSLYAQATGGDAVWTDKFAVTCDARGAYAFLLGDTTNHQRALSTADVGPEPRWIAVAVDTGGELTPRLRLATAPLAGRAALADAVIGAVEATGAIKQNGRELVSADGHFMGPTDNLDAATVGGVAASKNAAAGKLLPLGADGRFPSTVLNGGPTGDLDATSFGGGRKWADVTGAVADATANLASLTNGKLPDADLSVNVPLMANGKLPDANLSTNVPLLGAPITFANTTTFTTPATFAPTTGNVPFTVSPGASGMVPNLNAAQVGGHAASDFLLAATYKPPQAGAERLVLNFDEGAAGGTTVKDSSGAANDGSFVASTLTRTTSGHNGSGALTFAAGGGLVSVPDTGALSVTNNVTMEAWIYPTAYPTSGEATILMKENAYGITLDGQGRLRTAIQTAVASTWNWWGLSTPVPLNSWTHAAVTYNGVELQLYLNGVLSSTVAFPNGPIAVNANPLTVGGRAASSVGAFIGTIDEVRVSAVAKTFRQTPAFIKLAMAAAQTGMASGTIINFDAVRYANRMTAGTHGINVRAGHTYRLEAILNLSSPTINQYVGYAFFDGTSNIGDGCYSGFGAQNAYDFHAGCLEIYTPTADRTIQIRVFDPNTNVVEAGWNTYFIATEL